MENTAHGSDLRPPSYLVRPGTVRVLRALAQEPLDGSTMKERGILGRVDLRHLRQSGWITPAVGTGWRITGMGRELLAYIERHPEVVG